MRKEYLKPVMMTMELGTANLLAASAPRWEPRGGGQGDAPDSGGNGGHWGNLWNR